MITINNILKPIIDELLEIKKVNISTPSHPHGRNVSIKLVALIGGIFATHKVAGFMSHLAKYFCSWCELQDHNREELILEKPHQKEVFWGHHIDGTMLETENDSKHLPNPVESDGLN
ncbi:hypothetical protein O181_098083 [Austropuccinia psidii MF-1]|uniref:Uncharacterized protein n=1 Tax=Austropuccinia psidii MF-1 TaxID=1389203 RepID=A0A9Q3J8K1_9BASI|nr:hypothetical protein [Austropuccinia psidii MF-1]